VLIKLGGTVFNKRLFVNVKPLNSQCKHQQAQSTAQYFGV